MNLGSLADFANAERGAGKKACWQPPQLADFGYDRIIGWDPSLGGTGMCAIAHTFEDGLSVVGARRFAITSGLEGPEGAMDQISMLRHAIRLALALYSPKDWIWAIEAPPTGSNRLDRPESSWAANAALRCIAEELDYPVAPLVSVMEHKKATGGRGTLQKDAHHKILRAWAEPLIPGWSRHVTNKDIRDAASVALTELLRRKV